jgi:hypothetical protein
MNDLGQAYDGSMSLRVCYIAAAAAEFAIGRILNLQECNQKLEWSFRAAAFASTHRTIILYIRSSVACASLFGRLVRRAPGDSGA